MTEFDYPVHFEDKIIMWHAPEGEKTFTGLYARMLAHGMRIMTDGLRQEMEDAEEPLLLGHVAFDCLTGEQKIWALHKVAFGLLDPDTPICKLTAFLEATVASIFRQLEYDVELEIDLVNDEYFERDEEWDSYLHSREAIFTAYEATCGEAAENIEEDEEPLTLNCEETDEWQMALEILEAEVLWDGDYDLAIFDDMEPEAGSVLKQMCRIPDEYYSTIPEDPKRPEAMILLKEASDLCDLVTERESKP